MKNKFLILALLTTLFSVIQNDNLKAQDNGYKVVFDLTSADTADHQSLIRWLNGISKSNANAQLEVVLYGQSLPMVTIGKSSLADEVQMLAQNKNISFRVCAIAMKKHGLSPSDFLPGVETVPDGITEIVQKQEMGWAYIKAAR